MGVTRRVTVAIDELALDAVHAAPGLAEAVRAELTRLVSEHPPRAAASRRVVRAGALDNGPLGRGIARAVHRGLTS